MARRLEITKSILVLILAALLDFEVKGSSTVLCLSDLNLHFNDNWWVYVKLVHVKVSSFLLLTFTYEESNLETTSEHRECM